MSGKGIGKFVPGVVLLAAAGGLVILGLQFRTTDLTKMATMGGQDGVTIPAIPPATQVDPGPTDAFTRPLFHRNRAPGPDKAPAGAVNTDPDAPDAPAETSPAPVLKGLIIGEQGGRVALQAADGAAPVWVKVGEEVAGWKVERITAAGVRVRSGDEVADIKFADDEK